MMDNAKMTTKAARLYLQEGQAMLAIELIKEGDAEQANSELPKLLVDKAAEKGLIILSCGSRRNVIRLLPALTIPDDIIEEGLDILEQCFAELL
jgi:4-aminobutyrate aminotransferase/(S)-3-amino-2-methylpropionate transaminase